MRLKKIAKKRKISFVAVPFAILFAACLFALFFHTNAEPVTVWTCNKQVLCAADLFNAQNKNFKVSVHFFENPSQEIMQTENLPDVVLAPHLKTSAASRKFAPLNSIFSKNGLKKQDFYQKILNFGDFSGQQMLIPISFNLPIFIYKDEGEKSAATIDIKTLLDECEIFNAKNAQNSTSKIGFDPFWNPDFLYDFAQISGADFRATETGEIEHNEENLRSFCGKIQELTKNLNENFQAGRDFAFLNFFSGQEKSLLEETSRFSYSRSDIFLSRAQEDKNFNSLKFSFFCEDSKLPVCDDILCAAILSKSKNQTRAKEFLKWLLSAQNQKKIIQKFNETNFISTEFGILGGFSSLQETNKNAISVFYPELLSKISNEDLFLLPPTECPSWAEKKSQEIEPLLLSKCVKN